MKYRRQLLTAAAAWLFLLVFMVSLRPASLPVVVLIVPFILLFLALLQTWRLFYVLWKRPIEVRGIGKDRFGGIFCASLVLLVILQSLGQLTVRDSITIISLAVIGYLYLLRARPKQQKR